MLDAVFGYRNTTVGILLTVAALGMSACGGGSSRPTTQQVSPAPSPATAPIPEPVSITAASRLLEQASFGPTPETVAQVQQLGLNAYLDEQFAATMSTYDDPLSTDNGLPTLQKRFFTNAIYGKDQLRQRVAFALSQIFVISGLKISDPNAFVPYERMLLADAFGNYYNLLHDVTLSPVMGRYLDMVNNDKPNPESRNNPNENYAREVMQLFSIGLTKLNPDGTPLLDRSGNPLPTYTQDVIEGFAHVFTGWTYPTMPNNTRQIHNPVYYNGLMEVNEINHDYGTKLLLDGLMLPAGQPADKDLTDALQNIFNHANVGPFISFRLIQQLVTSNPSPAYVQRVARIFNNNGHGIRGDLKAVIKAILLDAEARRGDVSAHALVDDGKLKDPVLFVVGLLRTLNTQSDGTSVVAVTRAMKQTVFMPTNVFNYYPPNYGIHGTKLLGPEFKIWNNPAIVARDNFVNLLLMNRLSTGTVLDLTEWTNLAKDPNQLIDMIDKRLMRSAMSDPMRAVLIQAVNALPADNPGYRAQTALYLAATSSQYSIQH